MITLALIICVIGLILYVVSSDKTRRQLCEDVGRILFAAGALAVLIVWATKVLYP
jgi:hypothetical protein